MIALLPTIMAAAAEPQGIAALGIDPLAILAQAVTFLVFFWVIKKFALSKIINTLETRRKTIDKGVLLGLEMEKEKTALDEKVEKLLHQARLDSDKIIAQGQTEAGEILKAAEEAAQRKADALLADAHKRIGEDVERAKHDMKKEMVTLVGQATAAIIREKVDAKKDAQLIEKMLEGVK